MALVLGLFWCIHTEQNRDRGRNRDRDQNNGGQFQYQSRCKLKASTQFHTTHLFPVPISVPASVNTPLVLVPVHGHAIMATVTKSLLIGTTKILLPPANEVWGKVIFSQASVILYTGEGSLSGRGWSVQGGLCLEASLSREGLCPGEGLSPGGISVWGVSVQGGIPRESQSQSGQYASYWNAFLLAFIYKQWKLTKGVT